MCTISVKYMTTASSMPRLASTGQFITKPLTPAQRDRIDRAWNMVEDRLNERDRHPFTGSRNHGHVASRAES